LATLPLITLILAETWIPTRMGIPPWPAFHLGLAAGLVIWGRWRVFAPAAVGLALGHGLAAALSAEPPLLPLPVTWPDAAHPMLVATAEVLGLLLVIATLGPHRARIISGRVEVSDAVRLIGVTLPAAVVPTVGLVVVAVFLWNVPLDVTVLRVIAGSMLGLLAATPLTIALLPSRHHARAYRCHCPNPFTPMLAMGSLIVIGLLPFAGGPDPFRTMAIASVLAVGVLSWLALVSGWMATGMGMVVFSLAATTTSGLASRGDLFVHGESAVTLLPAFVIAILLASTMETRFRDRRRLTERHDELQSLIDATGVAFMRVDPEGRVLHANAAARHLANSRGATCNTLARCFSDTTTRRLRRAMELAADGRPRETAVQISIDGRRLEHHVVCTPLGDDRDGIRAFSIVLVDLRHRSRRERERRQRGHEQVRSLAHAYVHEVNSLAMEIGGAASLARETSEDTAVGRVFAGIEQSCESASRRVRRMHHLARSGFGPARPLDIGCVATARLRDAETTGRVHLDAIEIDPEATAAIDAEFAEFIFDEFVQNAVDAALGAVPTLSVSIGSSHRRPDTTDLVLRDDGPGIEDSILTTIGRSLISTKGRGRGFGLRAMFAGVKDAGGSMSVESSDGGTTIRIALPKAAAVLV
jgi:nitrogen-specific signal transduction histidine kinase